MSTDGLTLQNSLATTAPCNNHPCGGAILTAANTVFSITNSTFTGNKAPNGGGGAILTRGQLSVSNSTFTGNSTRYGSAIYNYDIRILVTDGSGLTATQAIVVTVTDVAEAPTAIDDSFEVTDGAPVTEFTPGLLSNDRDPEGNTLTATVVAEPQNGTLNLNTDGSFTYTPNDGYDGADGFTYKANDGSADSNTATVTIAVTAYEP